MYIHDATLDLIIKKLKNTSIQSSKQSYKIQGFYKSQRYAKQKFRLMLTQIEHD